MIESSKKVQNFPDFNTFYTCIIEVKKSSLAFLKIRILKKYVAVVIYPLKKDLLEITFTYVSSI